MRATLITTLKNEASFLLEWVAHHRALGFTDLVIFTNDCEDGTDAMAERLQALGLARHLPNPGPWPEGPQWAALKRAEKLPEVTGADWALVADVDEFVNIHAGEGRLADLVAAVPGADAVALTWRMFGNAGIASHAPGLVTRTFLRAAPATLAWPWRAQMIKTLFRPQAFGKLGVHRPKQPKGEPRWFDGSGRAVDLGGRLFSDYRQDNYRLVQMNHYALGSAEGFVVKCDRGRANREAGAFDMGYWVERNLNQVEDRSILRHDIAGPLAALLADAELARLQAAAEAWRQARIATLLAQEDWRQFFGRLLMAGPSRLPSLPEVALIQRRRNP
ncbi:glycosyltransferase family 2 protein [Stagnihabitans tardus]|uniref:Glycosyltransferase family 2 protein n=1 Tax=Stagnihabitans tardus TaxID=2699202 RepID=A0AAE4YA09_9RHOB|nr:glycosyltransferase family 2 protein [Stagnihabitans tardus]NBZ88752.1 glycosyltransferase family 2 protein [Stagnihabitans tardus]